MKTKITLIALIFLLGFVSNVSAQQPAFTKPDRSKNIPFGQKQPAPSPQSTDQKKIYQTLYAGADKNTNLDSVEARDKKSNPYEFTNPNSFLMHHLANRENLNTKNCPQGSGSNFQITNDINALAESDPGNINDHLSSLDWLYPVLNNVAYFEGDDGYHGRELLRTDGTAKGTYLVKDINPGEASTIIRNMVTIKGKVYFSASTDGTIYYPWVTDGTTAGTQMIGAVITIDSSGNHFLTYTSSYSPQEFVQVNNSIYYIASNNSYTYRTAIWKTDGTTGGTTFVKDIAYNPDYATDIAQATSVNGLLFFTIYTGSYGRQLWRSDGTDAGTYMLTNNSVYYDNNGPMQLTAYNNKLYFSMDDGNGRQLWISDGTTSGTTYAPGNNGIFMQTDYLYYDNTQPFPVLNNVLYLSGYTYADGNGLYKYDAQKKSGLVLVKDITPTSDYDFIVPGESRIVGNTLFMKVISSTGGWHDELWSTKGSASNTQLVKSWAGEPDEYMINLKSGYGTLYFFKHDDVYGSELWESDGTAAGTVIVKDINPGPEDSSPWYMTECNGKVIFSLHEDKTGAEPWSTTGSAVSTVIAKDVNTRATQGSSAAVYYNGTAVKDGMVFHAYEKVHGDELYYSDGTEYGTFLVNDINPGPNTSYPKNFSSKNGKAYFVAFPTDGNNPAIYQTNGLPTGLKKIFSYYDANTYEPGYYSVADNGIVFAVIFNWNTYNYELWRSDGTPAGSFLVASNLSYNYSMVTSGNNAFFVGGDAANGYELWKSDGSMAGTKIVKDINPGPDGSYPYSLFPYNGNVYFGAYDNTYINTLWKSDGTNAGTIKLGNIQIPYTYNNSGLSSYLCISKNTLYLNAFSNDTYQNGLWKTNGTTTGTQLVSPDFYYPYNLTDVSGTLFFTGYDNNGLELYKSKGTEASTTVVKDIENIDSSYSTPPQYFAVAGSNLYFVLNDVLWYSDGTNAGTQAVNDPFLSRLSSITNLTGVSNKLFFSATTYQYGFELFVGNASANSFNAQAVSSSVPTIAATDAEQELKIYPNPASNILNIRYHQQNTGNVTLTVTDISGRTLIHKNIESTPGNHAVSLSIQSLPAGSYFLKLNGNGNLVQQFVKQ